MSQVLGVVEAEGRGEGLYRAYLLAASLLLRGHRPGVELVERAGLFAELAVEAAGAEGWVQLADVLAGERTAEAEVRALQRAALALDGAGLRSAGEFAMEFASHPDTVIIELLVVLHVHKLYSFPQLALLVAGFVHWPVSLRSHPLCGSRLKSS